LPWLWFPFWGRNHWADNRDAAARNQYNGSMPAMFKTLIDGTSHFRSHPLAVRHRLPPSASVAMGGGHRGSWAAKHQPCAKRAVLELVERPPVTEAYGADPVSA
jgi:hypothetical protein